MYRDKYFFIRIHISLYISEVASVWDFSWIPIPKSTRFLKSLARGFFFWKFSKSPGSGWKIYDVLKSSPNLRTSSKIAQDQPLKISLCKTCGKTVNVPCPFTGHSDVVWIDESLACVTVWEGDLLQAVSNPLRNKTDYARLGGIRANWRKYHVRNSKVWAANGTVIIYLSSERNFMKRFSKTASTSPAHIRCENYVKRNFLVESWKIRS